jgi:hypothetical protein
MTPHLTTCVRDAFRGLRADRRVVGLAFLLLALTMTAGTVIFSVVDAVAIRPLPYAAPDRLVSLSLPSPIAGAIMPASLEDYVDWRDGVQAFQAVAASRPRQLQLERDGTVQTIRARGVTANLFEVLGVHPALDRTFGPDDAQAGLSDVVVLSHDLWTRRFAKDPSVIGRRFEIGGTTRAVIGVLPEHVQYPIRPSPAEMFFPHVDTAADRSDGRCCVQVVARLRDGVTLEQARAEVQAGCRPGALPLRRALRSGGLAARLDARLEDRGQRTCARRISCLGGGLQSRVQRRAGVARVPSRPGGRAEDRWSELHRPAADPRLRRVPCR